MIKTDGKSWPPNNIKKRWYKLWHQISGKLKKEIEIFDGERALKFRCNNIHELRRCMRIFTKEPGTIEWIKKTLTSGDVFYDIGSNIGIYTIFAANFVGKQGRIYSFEPQSLNFSRLLENIDANQFFNRIIPCNFALHDEKGFFDFIYSDFESGSAHHQLIEGPKNSKIGNEHKVAEFKYATTIDDLIGSGKIRQPQHIKIDVDGNEMAILKGMSQLLKDTGRPKSIQVELDKDHQEEILDFMKLNNYDCKETHYTAAGIRKIQEGQNPDEQVYNAIFCG
ncbi:MAG: FkbM family methyltransferase [Desulfobacterales bacterium]|jgi:FkbM family methyltransferase